MLSFCYLAGNSIAVFLCDTDATVGQLRRKAIDTLSFAWHIAASSASSAHESCEQMLILHRPSLLLSRVLSTLVKVIKP